MIVYDNQKELREWASFHFSGRYDFLDSEKDRCIGVKKNDKLICVVVYNNYKENINGTPLDMEMSIISIDKSWCNRHNLRIFFGYPFIQLGLERVHSFCSIKNKGAIMFAQKLGFKQEGVHRKAFYDGNDSVCLSLLKDECKWL